MPDASSAVGDDEIVLRHIPEIMVASDVVSSNFQLRPGEDYVSVSRQHITDATALLKILKTTAGSRIAAARVRDIRALGLKVEPYPSRRSAGHAGIEAGFASLDDADVRIGLAALFSYLDAVSPEN